MAMAMAMAMVMAMAMAMAMVMGGGHFGLIVLRHTASLFCHQRGSQSSYGALVRCIKSLTPSCIDSTWFRGLFFIVFLCFLQNCSFCDLNKSTFWEHKK